MKIYNIYPTNEAGIQIGNAVYQSMNKNLANEKFKQLETYSRELCYKLVEITFHFETTRKTHKTLKTKKYTT